MTARLVDTCVLIDYLRNRNEAVAFMRRIKGQPLVSVVTIAELFAGARSLPEQGRIEAALAHLAVREVDSEIARLGGLFCLRYRRSHGVELPDALIAATAQVHGARLVTRNVKHFPMLDDIIVPYHWN